MLEVKVNLVPFGIRSREKQIGYAKIWNDGTGSVKIGNYCYRIEDEDGKTIAEGDYKNFPRLEKNVMHLLKEILDEAI